MTELMQLVRDALDKDRRAILQARALGSVAVPTLIELAENSDGEVREIALHGLNEIDDPRGLPIFSEALLDPEPMVRGVAMRALHRRANPTVYEQLLRAYDQSQEPIVRHNIALVLGRMGPQVVETTELVRRLQVEVDPFAKEGIIVALLKLGYEALRQSFVDMLYSSRGRTRGRFLDHVDYIHAAWLVPKLAPILDDMTPVIRIGADGLPGPEYLRACDRALNLIVDISFQRLSPFSFSVGPHTNYTLEALKEVQQFAQSKTNFI